MRINSISANSITPSKTQSIQKSIAFGYGVSLSRRSFKEPIKTLWKQPQEVNKLKKLQSFLADKQEELTNILWKKFDKLRNEGEDAKSLTGLWPTIELSYKRAKGGISQIVIQNVHTKGARKFFELKQDNPIVITELFDNKSAIKSNIEEKLSKAVEKKAEEGANFVLKIEKEHPGLSANSTFINFYRG